MFSHIITSSIFILLILLLLWSNEDTFDTIGEKLKYKYDTMYNRLVKGGTYYHCLSKDENIEKFLRKKEKVLIFFLAPWCKESKKIKRSGILYKISKNEHVIVIDDKHPDTEFLMNTFNIKKFPSVCLYENKKIKKESIKKIKNYIKC